MRGAFEVSLSDYKVWDGSHMAFYVTTTTFFSVTLSVIDFTNIVIPTQSHFIQNANH
jgi:hypothetical protein